MTRRSFAGKSATLLAVGALPALSFSCADSGDSSTTKTISEIRVPEGGIQPQAAVGDDGVIHLVYFKGEDSAGDLFYTRSKDDGKTFSAAIRVNSQPASAVAAGAIRGAQIALGNGGNVHVAWNGSSKAQPRGPLNPEQPADSPHNGVPMLYARFDPDGQSFSEQRNLMQHTFALDGGGTIAADDDGNVLVAWHGKAPGSAEGEAGRQVFVTRSADNGKTFSAEETAFSDALGACACCGMKLFADRGGAIRGLFRSAREVVHRDMILFSADSADGAFQAQHIDSWEIGSCPMTSMSFAESDNGVTAAWETEERIRFGRIDQGTEAEIATVRSEGGSDRLKYPSLATNDAGLTLISWVEVGGWKQPGKLRYRLLDAGGEVIAEEVGPQLPVWSFAASVTLADGSFAVIY